VFTLFNEPKEYNNVDLTSLNEKQKAFCQEYAIDMNGQRSAKAVGYNPRNCYQLLAREDVRAYIAWLNESMRTERIATAQEIKERLTAIARGDAKEEVVLPDGKTVLKGTFVKDQTKALELLGKHYKLFTDVQEVKTETVFNIGFSEDEEEDSEDK
jgi:phage terminase small subunit